MEVHVIASSYLPRRVVRKLGTSERATRAVMAELVPWRLSQILFASKHAIRIPRLFPDPQLACPRLL